MNILDTRFNKLRKIFYIPGITPRFEQEEDRKKGMDR